MADILPARIEPSGDGAELPEDHRRERAPKPKPSAPPVATPPPLDAEEEESHQLDERA